MQAEAHESRDRLKLLGMNDEQFLRLGRSRDIQSHVPIVAPFAGRIIGRNLTRGEVVETTEKLFIIADLSEVWVLANIPETGHRVRSRHLCVRRQDRRRSGSTRTRKR